MAQECSMAPAEFEHAFCETAGVSPRRYLAQIRVTEAKKLLLEPHLSLTDVRVVCGFRSQRDFTRSFMQLTGRSPAAWRRHGIGVARPTLPAHLRESTAARTPSAPPDGDVWSARHQGTVSA
ncbi:helix-turn-helix transcriptional regulator [Bosea sp. RAF48]|uniref:helix-turn-helix transcriptional regulator n=1 Tax=Bosea sp. RAF48 TaxID=3237480 RepID=UPI003F8F65F9